MPASREGPPLSGDTRMAKKRTEPVASPEPVAPPAQPAQPAPRVFEIKLPHSPTLRVEADTAEQAWALYRVRMGLLATEHVPAITEVPGGE